MSEGIKGNSSTVEVQKSINQYTGLANMKVVAINPTREEIIKLFDLDETSTIKEPQYIGLDLQNDGNLQNKIVFYLKGRQLVVDTKKNTKDVQDISGRLEFLVASKERLSKTGKSQIFDKLGNSFWGTMDEAKNLSLDESINPTRRKILKQFVDNTPHHNALIGEEQVLNFVRNWYNLSNDASCNFSDPVKLFSGDVTELKNMLNTVFEDKSLAKDNEITVYMDVTENKGKYYQAIYGKAFSRPKAKNPEAIFAKSFGEEYGKPKALFTGFELKVFIPTYNVDMADAPESNTTKKNDFV